MGKEVKTSLFPSLPNQNGEGGGEGGGRGVYPGSFSQPSEADFGPSEANFEPSECHFEANFWPSEAIGRL